MTDDEQQAAKLKADYRQLLDQLRKDQRFTAESKLEQAQQAHTEVTAKLRDLHNTLAARRREAVTTARRRFLANGRPAVDEATSVLLERDAADRAATAGSDHTKVQAALLSALDRDDPTLARALAVHAEDRGMLGLADAWAEASGSGAQSSLTDYRRAVDAAGPGIDLGSMMSFSAPVAPTARDFPDTPATRPLFR